MASILSPYLTFSGNTLEAIGFYQSVLGGEVTSNTFRDYGNDIDGIMHAQLTTDAGYTIMASDAFGGDDVKLGNNVTLTLSGDDPILREYFAALSVGGTVVTPLEPQMWGDEYGMLIDKFGIPWMVNLSPATSPGDDA
ncbi:MAG TPA: VOC family protein [Propionibacteriaceae bacterium]|nr:VOC family protein [Propionibacteriaceae bacterium]